MAPLALRHSVAAFAQRCPWVACGQKLPQEAGFVLPATAAVIAPQRLGLPQLNEASTAAVLARFISRAPPDNHPAANAPR